MSKEKILKSIKQNKPQQLPLPDINLSEFEVDGDVRDLFASTLKEIGGTAYEVKNPAAISEILRKEFPDAQKVLSKADGLDIGTINSQQISTATDLDDLDLAIIMGQFGVAENGAIWVPESNFDHRSIPFITSHLAIILESSEIVTNMHQAYLRLGNFNEGYGVFIAGPSKTADIEQSLVIGAHGPLSLTVFLT